jgi:hypothetical protein
LLSRVCMHMKIVFFRLLAVLQGQGRSPPILARKRPEDALSHFVKRRARRRCCESGPDHPKSVSVTSLLLPGGSTFDRESWTHFVVTRNRSLCGSNAEVEREGGLSPRNSKWSSQDMHFMDGAMSTKGPRPSSIEVVTHVSRVVSCVRSTKCASGQATILRSNVSFPAPPTDKRLLRVSLRGQVGWRGVPRGCKAKSASKRIGVPVASA